LRSNGHRISKVEHRDIPGRSIHFSYLTNQGTNHRDNQLIIDETGFEHKKIYCWVYSIHCIRKFSSYIRRFRRNRVKMYIWLMASAYCIWLNICSFPHILGSPSSYMTLHPSEFIHIWGFFLTLYKYRSQLMEQFIAFLYQ
jgi:hypothetical protein